MLRNDDPNDDAEARRLFEAAAEAGSAEALNMVAYMVDNGRGGLADPQRARDLLHRAAELGSIGANATLSDYYGFGLHGYTQDAERGLRYAIAAAEAPGHPRAVGWAQWRLATRYLTGRGALVDHVQAFQWASRAADSGSVQGMNMRASMLALGQGTTENDVESRRWYQRAAESREPGSAEGLRSLGGMLLTGEGGAIDGPRGYAYLLLAQQAGDERTARVLPMLGSFIDDTARAQAPAIMEAWRREFGEPQTDPSDGN